MALSSTGKNRRRFPALAGSAFPHLQSSVSVPRLQKLPVGRPLLEALAAGFRREDPAAVLFEQWGVCKDTSPKQTGVELQRRFLLTGEFFVHPERGSIFNSRPRVVTSVGDEIKMIYLTTEWRSVSRY